MLEGHAMLGSTNTPANKAVKKEKRIKFVMRNEPIDAAMIHFEIVLEEGC